MKTLVFYTTVEYTPGIKVKSFDKIDEAKDWTLQKLKDEIYTSIVIHHINDEIEVIK